MSNKWVGVHIGDYEGAAPVIKREKDELLLYYYVAFHSL
jgi:hypothetical protein